jgi:hypothetical protein
MATASKHVLAAWPGTHEPTPADLDDQPGVLVLPDGWERATAGGRYLKCRIGFSGICCVFVQPDGITQSLPSEAYGGVLAREIAARLVEAAGLYEQLKAGAR